MFRWLDENIEKVVILANYVVMTGIIFVEVIRRFVFGQQAAWSSTIPIYLFLWVTWIGCAYCCKTRSHLRFEEFRIRLPYIGQFLCIVTDHLVWIGFSILVIYFSVQQVQLSYDNFAIVQGTDDVMQWWFYLATPLGFLLVIYRVLQNLLEDIRRFQKGEPMPIKANMAAD
jgi:TRAP-type C4-dicarboxylate transport system permease small subunit